jgi:ATP/ADP translocase
MDMVFYILLMEVNLKDNLLMVKQMGQVVLWIKMGIL